MCLINAPNVSSRSFFQRPELIGVSYVSDVKTSASGYKRLDKGKPVFHGNYETVCSCFCIDVVEELRDAQIIPL